MEHPPRATHARHFKGPVFVRIVGKAIEAHLARVRYQTILHLVVTCHLIRVHQARPDASVQAILALQVTIDGVSEVLGVRLPEAELPGRVGVGEVRVVCSSGSVLVSWNQKDLQWIVSPYCMLRFPRLLRQTRCGKGDGG